MTQSQKDVLYVLVRDKMKEYKYQSEQYIQLETIANALRPINYIVTLQHRDNTPKKIIVTAQDSNQAVYYAMDKYNDTTPHNHPDYVPKHLLQSLDVHPLSEDISN